MHYVFIKDFNRLMFSQTKTKNVHKKHFCMSCLQNFTTKEILNNHRKRCLLIKDIQAVKHQTGTRKLKNFNKQIPAPSKVYADSECSLKRVKLVCIDNRLTLSTETFTGSNYVQEFIEWVFEQEKCCNQIIQKHFNKKLKMTIEDEKNYQNLQNCWMCDQKIINDKDKVRDHCHIAGKYRGATHKECNSKLRIPRKLPIIFHNSEGYDERIICRELNNFKDIDIQVIPKSDERYMSIIVNNSIEFLDSLQF